MAAYWKQREHALGGGDHPDELEKNGQPQNEKKWNLNQASTKRNWAWNWQHRYKPVSWARHIGYSYGPNDKINEQTNKLKMKTTNDTRRRKETDGKETPKPATGEDKARHQYDTAVYVFTFVWIPSGTTFCSETPVLARIQRPERREITWTVHQRHL